MVKLLGGTKAARRGREWRTTASPRTLTGHDPWHSSSDALGASVLPLAAPVGARIPLRRAVTTDLFADGTGRSSSQLVFCVGIVTRLTAILELYSANADGSYVRRLTTSPGDDA